MKTENTRNPPRDHPDDMLDCRTHPVYDELFSALTRSTEAVHGGRNDRPNDVKIVLAAAVGG